MRAICKTPETLTMCYAVTAAGLSDLLRNTTEGFSLFVPSNQVGANV